jgi:hypothetical protein
MVLLAVVKEHAGVGAAHGKRIVPCVHGRL